jgi:antitoxin component of MazEF toxin-antitoxin module
MGRSPGVLLPEHLLAEAGIAEDDVVEVTATIGQIVLRQVRKPRAGWAEQFAEMARHGDDALIDGEQLAASSWDGTEWEF